MAKTILGPAPKKTILGPVEGFTGARRGPPNHKTLDNPEFQIPENDPWSRQKDMFSRVPEMETGTIAPTTIYRGQGDYPVQPSIGPMPEQNFWQKAKGFFVGQPDYGRWTKPTQLDYLHRTLDIPLNILTKFSSGRTFGADKLSWYVLSKIRPDLANKPLEEQMAALDPYEHSTFNKMTGEMAEFIGQIQSSQKLLSAIGINTPQGQKTIEKIVDKAPAWMMSGAIDAVVDGVVEEKEAKDVWKDVIVKSQTRAGEAVVWGGLEWGAGKIVQEIGKKFPRFSRAMQARLIKDPDKRQVRMDAIKAREHYRKYGTMPDDLMNKYVKPGLRGTDTDFTTQAANAAVEGEIVGIQALARQTPNMPVKQREAVLNHIKNLQKKIVSIEKQPQPTKVQEVTTKIPDTQIAQEPRTTPPAGESEQKGGVPQAQAEPGAGKLKPISYQDLGNYVMHGTDDSGDAIDILTSGLNKGTSTGRGYAEEYGIITLFDKEDVGRQYNVTHHPGHKKTTQQSGTPKAVIYIPDAFVGDPEQNMKNFAEKARKANPNVQIYRGYINEDTAELDRIEPWANEAENAMLAEKRAVPQTQAEPEAGKQIFTSEEEDFLDRFRKSSEKVQRSEKTPGREMNPEETEIMIQDWEAYSRSRGYTEKDIQAMKDHLRLIEEGQALGFTEDFLFEIERSIQLELAGERAISDLELERQYRKPSFEAENAMLAEKRAVPQTQAEPEAEKSIAEIQDQQMQSVAKGTKPAYLADRSSFDKEEYPAQLEKMKQFAKENDLVYGEKRDGQGDMNGVVAKDQETLNDVLSAKTGQELKSTLDYKQIENLSKKVEDEGFMALSDEEFNQFLDQQSTPLETGKPPIEETQEALPPEARNKGALDLGPLVDAAHTAHDWLFAFGEAKRSHPELYKALMSSYGKRNAGVERAVDEVQKILGERKLSTDEASAISLAYENKTLQPPKGLKDVSDKFLTLLGRLEQVQLKEGIFQRPFQERMIEENEQVIDRLKTELKHPDKSKRIQALVDENTKLRNMRYLPHSIVAQRVLEAKLNTLSGEKRKIFLDTWTRLSAQFKMRKGRGFLQEYMDAGLLSSEDVDIRRLSAQALSDYYYRSSMKDFFTFAKADGLIQPSSDQLRQEGWYNQRELGLTIPEAKGKMFHPLMATALNEMKEIRKGYPKNILRQMLAITKVGQFIKPTIVPTYDIIQKYMRGMWSLNPISEVRAMTEATRSVLTKDALYHKLNKDNLYQFPYEISKAGRDEQIQMMVDKTSLDVNILKNLWQSATGETWTAKDLFNARKMLMAGYRAIGNTTWTMDKIQRTQGYLVLRKLGLEHNEAVDTAAQGFGGYSLTSSKYKNQMSKVFFVHTFRFLMPREMAKTMTEPIVGAAKVAFGGDKIPKARWNRWAKALVGTAAIPVLTDQYMQYRGFEKDRKHIGPLAWKWKKDVPAYNADGTMKLKADGSPVTQELVVGINNILNMPVKYWNRATYYDPVSPSNRFVQAFKNLAKWEVHPLYRVMIWDIAQNRKSFGSGVQVYDPNETPIKQAGDILKYTFGQMFRLYGTMMDAAEAGNITEKEAKEQEHVYKNHLTSIDRILLKAIGYRYIRQDLNDRRKIKALSLNKEYNSRLYNIARKYSGEEAQRKKKNLDLWYKKTKTWIIDTMD